VTNTTASSQPFTVETHQFTVSAPGDYSISFTALSGYGPYNDNTVLITDVSLGPPLLPFQITSIVLTNTNDLLITWNTAGTNNIVQVSAHTDASGSFSTNVFADLTNIVVVTATTNFWDVGAATNGPSRYYRVRSPQ
jgi:hypothetical protein